MCQSSCGFRCWTNLTFSCHDFYLLNTPKAVPLQRQWQDVIEPVRDNSYISSYSYIVGGIVFFFYLMPGLFLTGVKVQAEFISLSGFYCTKNRKCFVFFDKSKGSLKRVTETFNIFMRVTYYLATYVVSKKPSVLIWS